MVVMLCVCARAGGGGLSLASSLFQMILHVLSLKCARLIVKQDKIAKWTWRKIVVVRDVNN